MAATAFKQSITKGQDVELKAIHIDGYTIRRRGGGSLEKWYESIDGVMTYRSFAAEAYIGGEWLPCIISARISDTDHRKIEVLLTFSDGTMLSATEHRRDILPDEYIQAKGRYGRVRKGKDKMQLAASLK